MCTGPSIFARTEPQQQFPVLAVSKTFKGLLKGCVPVCVRTRLSAFVWTKLWFLVLAVRWTFKELLEGCVSAYACVCTSS